jgi:methylated-DNA-[protein]-cysteine S-methyltransferase
VVSALWYARVPTVHGSWWLAWTDDGVCAGAQPEWDEEHFTSWLRVHHDGELVPGDPAGVPDAIDLRFVTPGFRRDVLAACARIPEGEVRTYGELAVEAGRPGAARAVGTAMATNPLPPVVPCHRVVLGDGRIGEYGAGGQARKLAMLTAEGVVVRNGVVQR